MVQVTQRSAQLSVNLIYLFSLSSLFIHNSAQISRKEQSHIPPISSNEILQYCSNAIFRAVEYKYKNWLHENLKNANDNFVQKPNIKNRRTESSKQKLTWHHESITW